MQHTHGLSCCPRYIQVLNPLYIRCYLRRIYQPTVYIRIYRGEHVPYGICMFPTVYYIPWGTFPTFSTVYPHGIKMCHTVYAPRYIKLIYRVHIPWGTIYIPWGTSNFDIPWGTLFSIHVFTMYCRGRGQRRRHTLSHRASHWHDGSTNEDPLYGFQIKETPQRSMETTIPPPRKWRGGHWTTREPYP